MKFRLVGKVVFKSGHVNDFRSDVDYDSEEECKKAVMELLNRTAQLFVENRGGYFNIATAVYRTEDISMVEVEDFYVL